MMRFLSILILILACGSAYAQRPGQTQDAPIDSKRIGFAPVVAPFANLAAQDASTWSTLPGQAIVTTGIKAPDATTGAASLSTNSPITAGRFVYSASRTLRVGDRLIAAVWVKAVSQQSGLSAQPAVTLDEQAVASITADDATQGYHFDTDALNYRYLVTTSKADTEWEWVTTAATVIDAPSTPSATVKFELQCTNNRTLAFYAPLLYHVLAGEMTDDEAAALLRNLYTVPDGVPAGAAALLRGQTLYCYSGGSYAPCSFGGGGGLTGSGVNGRLALWNGTSSLTSNANLLYGASSITVKGSDLTASTISPGDALLTFGTTTNLQGIALDLGGTSPFIEISTRSDTAPPILELQRARASNNLLQSGDVIGEIDFVADSSISQSRPGVIRGVTSQIQSSTNGGGRLEFLTTPLNSLTPAIRLTLDSQGNAVIGTAALATNATDGFLYLDSMVGVPTGTPTIHTGRVPVTVDTSNSRLYSYIGGAWVNLSGAGGGSPGAPDNSLQYRVDATTFGGLSGLTTDGTNVTAGTGILRASRPRITTGVDDISGNRWLSVSATPSAVNSYTIANAAASGHPKLTTEGSDANINIDLQPKGAANVRGIFGVGQGFIAQANGSSDSPLNGFANSSGTVVGGIGLALGASNYSSLAATNDIVIRSGSASGAAGHLILTAMSGKDIKFGTGTNDASGQNDTLKATITSAGRFEAVTGNGSTSMMNLNGTLAVQFNTVGCSGSSETDLHSKTIPANTLALDGDQITADFGGRFANNANSKTIKVYFGGTVIYTAVAAFQNIDWHLRVTIIRDASGSVRTVTSGNWQSSVVNTFVQLGSVGSLTFSSGIVLKVTGQGTSNNDIEQTLSVIRKGGNQ